MRCLLITLFTITTIIVAVTTAPVPFPDSTFYNDVS